MELGSDKIAFQDKARMILDSEDLTIYIGKPKLFSRDVPSTRRWIKIGLDALESIDLYDDGKLIMKNYYIQIQLKSPFPSGYNLLRRDGLSSEDGVLVLWTSKSEGEMFLRNYNALLLDRAVKERDREEIKNNQERYILALFKSSGKINLVEFAKKNRDNIHKCLFDKDIYSQPLSDEVSLRILKDIVRSYITDNKLNGVIDEQTNEYTDRDFIERKQKVVSVNMDFNTLVQQLGNKGINLTAIQCPQCQATCTVPPEGTRFQCESCDAVIEITDIIEKFRSFLT